MPRKFYVRAGLSTLSGMMALSVLSPAFAGPPEKAKRANMQLASMKKTASVTPTNVENGYEKTLLGVRILQSYENVRKLWGEPYRIFRADELLELTYDYDAKGKTTGGILDVVSNGDANNGAGAGGASPPPSSSTDDNPDSPPDDPNNPGGSPGGGINGSSQEKPPETFGQSGGYVWVYRYTKEKKVFLFEFNGQGRVLAIEEMGQGRGLPTKRGITLGSSLGAVYTNYGWPDTVQENKEDMQLFYDIKHHCQFNVTNNRVTGIAVVLSEGLKIHKVKTGGGGGGGGGPRGGGTPGGPGSGPLPGAPRRPGAGG